MIPYSLPAHHDTAWKTCKGRFSYRKYPYFSERKYQCSLRVAQFFSVLQFYFGKAGMLQKACCCFWGLLLVLLRCKSKLKRRVKKYFQPPVGFLTLTFLGVQSSREGTNMDRDILSGKVSTSSIWLGIRWSGCEKCVCEAKNICAGVHWSAWRM